MITYYQSYNNKAPRPFIVFEASTIELSRAVVVILVGRFKQTIKWQINYHDGTIMKSINYDGDDFDLDKALHALTKIPIKYLDIRILRMFGGAAISAADLYNKYLAKYNDHFVCVTKTSQVIGNTKSNKAIVVDAITAWDELNGIYGVVADTSITTFINTRELFDPEYIDKCVESNINFMCGVYPISEVIKHNPLSNSFINYLTKKYGSVKLNTYTLARINTPTKGSSHVN